MMVFGFEQHFDHQQHCDTCRSGAEEEAQNTAVAASLEDPAFISNDIVRFDWAAAAAAHPMCTGIGIGAPTDEIVRDCLVLLNNPDEEEEDEGDAAGDDGSLAVPHQCHLYGDLHLHESGFVLRVPGVAPIPVSFFEAAEGEGGDVARAAVVDACPRELSLLHIDFTERARDILFNEVRACDISFFLVIFFCYFLFLFPCLPSSLC